MTAAHVHGLLADLLAFRKRQAAPLTPDDKAELRALMRLPDSPLSARQRGLVGRFQEEFLRLVSEHRTSNLADAGAAVEAVLCEMGMGDEVAT